MLSLFSVVFINSNAPVGMGSCSLRENSGFEESTVSYRPRSSSHPCPRFSQLWRHSRIHFARPGCAVCIPASTKTMWGCLVWSTSSIRLPSLWLQPNQGLVHSSSRCLLFSSDSILSLSLRSRSNHARTQREPRRGVDGSMVVHPEEGFAHVVWE